RALVRSDRVRRPRVPAGRPGRPTGAGGWQGSLVQRQDSRRAARLSGSPPADSGYDIFRVRGAPRMTATDVYYDPYDYVIDADPYPVWKRLRDEAPVYHNERLDFWALSRYDDVLRGLLAHESFVSSHGIMLEIMTEEPYGIPMMIMMDPPEHTKLRKLVARAFTPRRIADLEVKIAALANDLFDEVGAADEFDYIERFAGLLPPTVILSLVGYPEGHAQRFKELTDQ